MIVPALAALVLAQAPMALAAADGPAAWRAYAAAAPRIEAVAVRGEAELDPAAAFASARKKAEEHLRDRWRQRANDLVVERRPFWMPRVLAEKATEEWLTGFHPDQALEVVDREDRTRDHGFGNSYQTTLWVSEPEQVVRAGERSLRRQLTVVTRKTLITSGATVVFWATLAMMLGWLDRLSRGYMSGRLFLIGLLLSTGVPAVAFLL